MTNIVMLIGPGRYRLTRQALESLICGTDPATYTLTMVCDELDFRTESLIKTGLHTTALHVKNSGHTLSQLKNIGVAWSEQRFGRGDWLYISDSDVWFSPGWLEKLSDCAKFSNPVLWGGQIHPFHQPIKREDDSVFWQGGIVNDGPDRRYQWTTHSVLDGPSWMMRWSTWDQYGPFDRTTPPGVCQSEEYPFCERLTKPRQLITGDGDGGTRHVDGPGGRIGVISPHVVVHTGLTHLDGHDCVGRKEREAMIPKGVLAK